MEEKTGMDGSRMEQKDENVNCFRRCKRKARRAIGWSTLPMRYQMRIHLFILYGIFFICYFVFLYIYVQQIYIKFLLENVSKKYQNMLVNRLRDASLALGTAVFSVDKVGIDSVLRLSDVF